MFVDEVNVKLLAGPGGDGCQSFRREKFIPMGGPDGGNGGRGGSIIFEGDKGLRTLVDLKYHKIIKAKKGANGKGDNKYGANAEDIVIKVPLGTVVTDADTNLVIKDITKDKERVIVAKGGRGGRGNKAFATKDNVAPHFSEKGEPGEERYVKCELRMIADVGLIGMPSVGKSTILSNISACHPKIASYHFTTLSPNLGVVTTKKRKTFVMADLPGLIEGASKGVGLGDKFLKHATRSKILVHVLDMGAEEGRNPIEDYEIINNEIKEYDPKLLKKEVLVVANKMDLPNAKENLEKFKNKYKELEVCPISAASLEGLNDLIETISDKLDNIKEENLYSQDEMEETVIYKFKEELPFSIKRDNNLWVISGDKIEKMFKMTKFDSDEAAYRFAKKLKRMGVDEELSRLGAKEGDEISIMGFIFEYKE